MPTVSRADLVAVGTQEHFAVVCDACGGKKYLGRTICEKCQGEGKILVRERLSFLARIRKFIRRENHARTNRNS